MMCHHLDAGELGEMLVGFGSHFERKPELGGIAFKLDWQLLLTTVREHGVSQEVPSKCPVGLGFGKACVKRKTLSAGT